MAESFWEESVQQQQRDEQEKQKEHEILKRLLSFWYIPVILLAGIIMSETLAFLAMLILMVGLAVLVSFYRKIFKYDLGIELISFFSITTSVAVHPAAGALVAAASVWIIDKVHKRKRKFRNARLLAYAGLCFLAGFFAPAGIVWTGFMLVLLRKAIFIIMTFFHDPEQMAPNVSRIVINIFVNLYLFAKFGEWMVGVLGG